MKKSGKSILYLAIVILVIAIAILIGIIINLSKANNLIGKQEEDQGQQLTETTSSNSYIDMATHLSELETATNDTIQNIQLTTICNKTTESWNSSTSSLSQTVDPGTYFISSLSSWIAGDGTKDDWFKLAGVEYPNPGKKGKVYTFTESTKVAVGWITSSYRLSYTLNIIQIN